MSYRVETASSGRAVCRAKECKDEKIMIEKGELRLGTWVTFQDRGSWHWRHWGCVTGKQIENLRNFLEDPKNPGVYRWDFLDGYEEDGKNSLDKHPDLQAKVRRVITQGYIDPEDFNGDPEMNRLGSSGLRTPLSKKHSKEEAKNRENELAALQEAVTAATAERDALLERGASITEADAKLDTAKAELNESHKKKDVKKRVKDESDAAETPVKKKRKTKAKKEESDNEEAKPAKKARGKKAIKEEDSEEEIMPAKKSRGKNAVKEEDVNKIKNEDDFDAAANLPAPKKRAPRTKKVKEEVDEQSRADDAAHFQAKAIPSTKKGRSKKAVKEESIEENNAKAAVKSPKVNRVTVKRGRGKTTAPADVLNTDEESPTAGGPSNDIKNGNELENKALEAIVDEDAEAMEPVAKKKGGKAKKTAAPMATPKIGSRRATTRGKAEE